MRINLLIGFKKFQRLWIYRFLIYGYDKADVQQLSVSLWRTRSTSQWVERRDWIANEIYLHISTSINGAFPLFSSSIHTILCIYLLPIFIPSFATASSFSCSLPSYVYITLALHIHLYRIYIYTHSFAGSLIVSTVHSLEAFARSYTHSSVITPSVTSSFIDRPSRTLTQYICIHIYILCIHMYISTISR